MRVMRRLLTLGLLLCAACSSPSAQAPATGVLSGSGEGNGNGHESHGNGHGDGHDHHDHDDDDDAGAATVTIFATDVSSLSGGEALVVDGVSCGLFVKSLQDPAGSPVEITRLDPSGAVTGTRTLSIRSSDLAGIAVDPMTGRVLVADESVRRIASLDFSSGSVGTTFSVPWAMNPGSNGTGQHQYAADPDASLLYFWDSTRSRLFRLDRLSGGLASIHSTDGGVADGQHLTSWLSDAIFDPRTRTVILADSLNGRVVEIDPSVSPAAVTTLFDGVYAPHALALSPSGDRLYVSSAFHDVMSGPRGGGTLGVLAGGFVFVTDIVACGDAVFAVDKYEDTVYRIDVCSAG